VSSFTGTVYVTTERHGTANPKGRRKRA
jgi:hypothetical protein